jgi:hypothetical protein
MKNPVDGSKCQIDVQIHTKSKTQQTKHEVRNQMAKKMKR